MEINKIDKITQKDIENILEKSHISICEGDVQTRTSLVKKELVYFPHLKQYVITINDKIFCSMNEENILIIIDYYNNSVEHYNNYLISEGLEEIKKEIPIGVTARILNVTTGEVREWTVKENTYKYLKTLKSAWKKFHPKSKFYSIEHYYSSDDLIVELAVEN